MEIRTLTDVTYQTTCDGIDWHALNQRLTTDDFDNGRTDAQLRLSFENSARVVFACASTSTRRMRRSAIASAAARLTAVVVFPTPPFWLTIAMMRPNGLLREAAQSTTVFSRGTLGAHVFHVETPRRAQSVGRLEATPNSHLSLQGFSY